MTEPRDWALFERRCRAGLSSLDFLVGRFAGEGVGPDGPLRAQIEGRRLLSDTFLELREQQWGGSGELVHEDIAFFRFDPDEERIRVQHLMAPGWVEESQLLPLEGAPGGFSWASGPFTPRVLLLPEEGGFLVEVWMPLAADPEQRIHYRPL